MAGEKGSTVILLHGVGCHVEFWEKNIAALAQEHRVFAIDIVGFGRTDKPDEFYRSQHMAYMANFVLDFMNAMDIDKASLVGNSMGGGISIVVAAQAPERVEKIVLVDSAGLGRKISFMLRLMTIPVIGEVLTKPTRQGAVRFVQMGSYDPSQINEDFIDRVADINKIPGNQRSLLSVLRESLNMFGMKKGLLDDFSSCLKKINAPILVIWGRQDRIIPVTDGEVAVEKMTDVRLHIMDQAGHSPQIDKPEEFNAAVLDFLRN
jgi:4,5:9,10-diseco-3-hydroxy-5,9,17-trioxoandrosta-1(10),2-diene-4-oate hydrolase